MSKHLPMAIEPSIDYQSCHFELIELHNTVLLTRDFIVEVNNRLFETSVAQFLGLDEMRLQESAITCVIKWQCIHGRMNCIKFITYDQMMELLAKTNNPRADKFKPLLSQVILTKVMPLFNSVVTLTPEFETLPEIKKPETMSSLEIAKLTGKRHKDILHDIRNMLKELNILTAENSAAVGTTYKNSRNQSQPMYLLNEELTLTLTSGYSVPQRNAIIKEWQAHRKGGVQTQPVPSTQSAPVNPSPQTITTTDQPPTSRSVNASFLKTTLQQIDAMELSAESRQLLKAHLLHQQAGLPLELMLPVVRDEKLSPSQIGDRLKISAQAVGRIISKLGIRGNQNYCEARLSVSHANNKEVVMYYYNRQAVTMIEQSFREQGK